jgi:hypothetical protein
MKYIAIAAILLSSCYGAKGYDRALDKCKLKCYPYAVRSVEYNFSNNRYDICMCNLTIKVEPMSEDQHDEQK